MSTQRGQQVAVGATAEQLGVGMRLSVHPHCDDFEEVILGALADVSNAGLSDQLLIETDEVSTYVGAPTELAEEQLARFALALIAAAWRRCGAGHVVAHILLSRGCPGEVSCQLDVAGLPTTAPVVLEPTGIRIEAAIAAAQARRVASRPTRTTTRRS